MTDGADTGTTVSSRLTGAVMRKGEQMGAIERQMAIDAINSHFGFNIEEEYGSAVQEVINGLPPAKPKWIPCSERLPRAREWVFCQCRAGIMDVLRLTEDGDWNKNYPHAVYMNGFVIAWMPLPEPYKGEAMK